MQPRKSQRHQRAANARWRAAEQRAQAERDAGIPDRTDTDIRAVHERDIEKHLVKRVKALGGEVRKVAWIGRRGAPDRLVMVPGYVGEGVATTAIWVELKAPGVKAEAHQVREHDRMRKMGQRVVVIDSIEGVEELLA